MAPLCHVGRHEMCVRRRFVIVISYSHTCLFGFRILASSPGDGVGGRLRMLDHMTGLWSSQLLALPTAWLQPLFFN